MVKGSGSLTEELVECVHHTRKAEVENCYEKDGNWDKRKIRSVKPLSESA
jgi:hypothetical protein